MHTPHTRTRVAILLLALLYTLPALAQDFLTEMWEIAVPLDDDYYYALTHTFVQLLERTDGNVIAFGQGNYGYEHDPHLVSSYLTLTTAGDSLSLRTLQHPGAHNYWARTALHGNDSYLNTVYWSDTYYPLPYGFKVSCVNRVGEGFVLQWVEEAAYVDSYDMDVSLLGTRVSGDGIEPDTLIAVWREWGDNGSGFRIQRYATDSGLVGDSLYTSYVSYHLRDVLIEQAGAVNVVHSHIDGPEEGYQIIRVNPAGDVVAELANPAATSANYGAAWLRDGQALIVEIHNETDGSDDYLRFWWHGLSGQGGGVLTEPRNANYTHVSFVGAGELPDGRIVALVGEGEDEYATIEDEYFLYLLDSNATELLDWQPLGDGLIGRSLLVHSDGTVLVGGSPHSWQNYHDSVWGYLLTTAVDERDDAATDLSLLPSRLRLSPVWPNPFNSTATVQVDLTRPGPLSVTVHDLLGRPVQVLHDGPALPGTYRLVFAPGRVASGTYLLRAETEDEFQVRRMQFLK